MRRLWNEDAQELLSVCEQADDVLSLEGDESITRLALLTVGCPSGHAGVNEVLVVVSDEDNYETLKEVRDNRRSPTNNIESFTGYIFDANKSAKALNDYFV